MKTAFVILTLFLTSVPLAATRAGPASSNLRGVTVPMRLELNRPYVDVTVTGPSGHPIRVHTWLDTGGGAIMVSAGLAQRLGLKRGAPVHNAGQTIIPTRVPEIQLGGMKLKLTGAGAIIAQDSIGSFYGTDAQMALPVRVLRAYVVVFGYPTHTFSVTKSAHPKGMAVKSYIGQSGMPAVWLRVNGKAHGFLLDTGGQYCMISSAALDRWTKQQPNWPHIKGAYGPANMLMRGEAKLGMVRIGEMQWGPFKIRDVGAVSRPPHNYEKAMSKFIGRPVIGSIAGNLLSAFRVTIDYPNGRVYLKRKAPAQGRPLNMVGLMLEPAAQGGYKIVATHGRINGIEKGDRLLKIDGRDVTHAVFYQLEAALQGRASDPHVLTIERDGKVFAVKAPVRHIL